MDPHNLHPWYLTGLLEALGSFGCARNGRSWQPSLDVTLPPGHADLVRRLQAVFGGRLVRDGRGWRLTRREELLRIVEHLAAFPLQAEQRRRTAELWSAIVRGATRARGARRAELDALVERLHALLPRRPRRTGPAMDSDRPVE